MASVYDLLRELVVLADKNSMDPGQLTRRYYPVLDDAEARGVFGNSADHLAEGSEQ